MILKNLVMMKQMKSLDLKQEHLKNNVLDVVNVNGDIDIIFYAYTHNIFIDNILI